jgi:hypothetical protein
VRDTRKDLAVDVGEDVGEGLAPLGGGRGKGRPELPRAQAGKDRELLSFGQVPDDPVDQTPALLAEGLEIDVSGQGATPLR